MMRVWGRDRSGKWTEVTTDSNGFDDNVYLTAIGQVLLLDLLESPFFANYGIPQYQSIVTQVVPNYYVARVQQQYSGFFASLVINPVSQNPPRYNVTAVTHNGALLNSEIVV